MVSITKLSKSELFVCLQFLNNRELWDTNWTCVWFREAFFALVEIGGRRILNLVSEKSYRFPSLRVMTIYDDVERLFKIDFKRQLPQLTKLNLFLMKKTLIRKFPMIDSLSEMYFCRSDINTQSKISGEHYVEREQKNDVIGIQEISSNLKKLILNKNSYLMFLNMISTNLETFEVRESFVVGDVSAFSGLRSLLISCTAFPERVFNVATGLKKLEILWPEPDFTLTPKPFLIHLEMISNEFPEWFLPSLTRLFPVLRYLSIGTTDCFQKLNEISPHPFLETLQVMGMGRSAAYPLKLEHLSYVNFPRLSKLLTDAKYLELSTLATLSNLKTLVVEKCAKIRYLKPLEINYPNLEIVLKSG